MFMAKPPRDSSPKAAPVPVRVRRRPCRWPTRQRIAQLPVSNRWRSAPASRCAHARCSRSTPVTCCWCATRQRALAQLCNNYRAAAAAEAAARSRTQFAAQRVGVTVARSRTGALASSTLALAVLRSRGGKPKWLPGDLVAGRVQRLLHHAVDAAPVMVLLYGLHHRSGWPFFTGVARSGASMLTTLPGIGAVSLPPVAGAVATACAMACRSR